MERYSKKLVSKCIYIQILKCTGAELLGQFMTVGGWNLVHTWLKDGNQSQNWPFVQEILEMFLLCPVDSNRLKSNHTPKIVKEMSENSPNPHLKQLSMKLVQQWLKIAYTEKQAQLASTDNNDNKVLNSDSIELKQASQEGIKYKISNKEEKGKILLSLKRSTSPASEVKEPKIAKIVESDKKLKDDKNDKEKSDKKSKSSSSSSSHKSSSKSSHKDKDRSSSSRSKSSSSSSSSKDKHHKSSSSSSKSSSSSSSRDKSKDKDKDREKRKKEEKEKAEKAQAEKDKETLSFLQPLPSAKLTKIPKKSENSENKSSDGNSIKTEPEKKKPSFSIESRSGDKPKTVKTLNSQFRDHGLAAEAPKPPSRKDIKKPGAITTPVIAPLTVIPSIAKSSSVISPTTVKKDKLEKALEVDDIPERVGGAKLIKPKRKYSQISNTFVSISLQMWLF
jgi:protein phosphatase 1 regulatory subunit 10